LKTLFPRMSDLLPAMVDQSGSRQIQWMCEIFLVSPAVVMLIACGFSLALWRVDPFVRFAHMVWVLGFWMLGTLELFGFIIPARLKIGIPFQLLFIATITLFLAAYFTPLSRFTTQFSTLPGLVQTTAIGILNGVVSWRIVYRYKNKIFRR